MRRPESYSSITRWEKCPASYKFRYIDHLPDPPGPAAERGNLIHAGLDVYFNTGDWPVYTTLVDWKPYIAPLRGTFVCDSEIAASVDHLWTPSEYEDPTTYYRGKIDLTFVDAAGTRHIIDWKTGKRYPTHHRQGRHYAALTAFGGALAVPPARTLVSFVYLDEEAGPEAIDQFEVTANEYLDIRLDVDRTIARIRLDQYFPPRPGEHCDRCVYNVDKGGPCKRGVKPA